MSVTKDAAHIQGKYILAAAIFTVVGGGGYFGWYAWPVNIIEQPKITIEPKAAFTDDLTINEILSHPRRVTFKFAEFFPEKNDQPILRSIGMTDRSRFVFKVTNVSNVTLAIREIRFLAEIVIWSQYSSEKTPTKIAVTDQSATVYRQINLGDPQNLTDHVHKTQIALKAKQSIDIPIWFVSDSVLKGTILHVIGGVSFNTDKGFAVSGDNIHIEIHPDGLPWYKSAIPKAEEK